MNTWTDEQLANYECALETIGNVIALKARAIAAETAKSKPDEAVIAALRAEQIELVDERSRLRIGDSEAVARAIEVYGKQVRENS
ncbi:conserved hypothetical protein [Burkholderia diffusa]|uniref:hypothetical protein n=1 Tax=Burkholderia diffusa TaxID=488732 RepID=UPI001CAFA91E|nr:hypothetical protein [Burkholderia diffusa]CAG9260928.1 conserved hypothetical protein [Burkholderia diffusa]